MTSGSTRARHARALTRSKLPLAALVLALGLPGGAEPAANDDAANRGVAALGRLEPLGGVLRVAAPSTPDAFSGAVLVKLQVERGDNVKAGQLLAEVDTAAISKSRVAEATAEIETARRNARASASLANEACVRAEVAARMARRKSDLLTRGLGSDEDADQAKGEAEASAAACEARKTETLVAESRIAGAEARLARHRAELERSYVRAPFDGRVLDVLARPGELVGLDGILELGRVNEMYAIAEVYETDIRHVRVNQPARVRSSALPKELAGKVTRIRPKVQKMDQIGTDPAARKDARIIEVEIRLDEPAVAANFTHLQVEIQIGR
jgi:HlyD family secretion protein